MAPIRDTTRSDILRLLAGKSPERDLPARIFIKNTPVAELKFQDGGFVLFELWLNDQRAKEGFEVATREGRGFRPESYWAYYEARRLIFTTQRLGVLRAALRLMPWPPRPGLRNGLARGFGAIFG